MRKFGKGAVALIILGTILFSGSAEAGFLKKKDKVSSEPTHKAEKKAEGNLRYSISVTTFQKAYQWVGPYDIAGAFSMMLTDALNASGHFIVLGDTDMRMAAMAEQDFAASGRTAKGKKAPKTGRMTPAQLLIKGSVTHVESKKSGGAGKLRFKGISLGGSKGKAEINLTFNVIDTETGQIKASTKIVGKSGKKGLSVGYYGSGLGGLTGDMAGFKNDNVGKATEDAMRQAVEFLVEQLEDIPWQGSILMSKGSKIIVNRGSREGVTVGQKFEVGDIEELVDDDTGEVLDTEMTKVGTIKVTKVKEKVSYCAAVSGKDFKKGMTVQP
ncbi:MAG: hypothetical protein KAI74_06595 [Kiritimatiellae bacterium]|nr:hypothetical protein [Kiritimatiellia bacterium]